MSLLDPTIKVPVRREGPISIALSVIFIILGVLFFLLLVCAGTSFGQTGALSPWATPTFSDGNAPLANGFVCTYRAGTTSPLTTYQDDNLVVPNQNPIRLSSAGQPINGSALVSIYLQPLLYKFSLYHPGVGNLCNGVTVGALVRTIDNIYDFGQLINSGAVSIPVINNTSYCVTGATADAKFRNAVSVLPSTGGRVDCTNLQGLQNWQSTVTVTKPIIALFGAAQFNVSSDAFIVNAPMSVVGAGKGTTVFEQTSPSATVFNVVVPADAFYMTGVSIVGSSAQTSGAGVVLDSASTENKFSIIENNQFTHQWIAIKVHNALGWHITKNEIDGIESVGVQVEDTNNADGTDSWITDNTFSCSSPTGHTGVYHLTGGGLSVNNNKFLVCDDGYHMHWTSDTDSSQVQIQNNRFDLNSVHHVWFDRQGGSTGTVSSVQIENNYFNSNVTDPAVPILFTATTTNFVYFPQIVGNHIQLNDSGKTAIVFAGTNGDVAEVSDNIMYGQAGSGGVSIGAGYTQMNVCINHNLTETPYTGTTGLRGCYNYDKLGVGISPTVTLINEIEIANNTFLGTRDCTLVMSNCTTNNTQRLIGEDQNNNVSIAANNQPVITGTGAFTAQGSLSAVQYITPENCGSVANPAVCDAAQAGNVVIAAAATSVTVNTTKVTASSEVIVDNDSSLGTRLGVTCNTQSSLTLGAPRVTARTAGVSFTVTIEIGPTTDPMCLNFWIIN